MAGIPLSSQFNLNAQIPLDSRFVKADLTERDAIDTIQRYEGLISYVVSEQKNYQLVGGVTNAHWVELQSGGSSSNLVKQTDVFTVDATIISNGYVTLTQDLVTTEHEFVMLNGQVLIEGASHDYTIVGTDQINLSYTLTVDDYIVVKYKYLL
jgi:hypothetical protein